jgi:hypothetical protein
MAAVCAATTACLMSGPRSVGHLDQSRPAAWRGVQTRMVQVIGLLSQLAGQVRLRDRSLVTLRKLC